MENPDSVMRILAVDTATEICGVAIMIDEEIVTESITPQGRTHAQGLLETIRWALVEAGTTIADLTGLVVTQGPGSFTGLRIGISTVKGLAAAIGKPMVGISTLAVLAHQAPDSAHWVCPMIDARRNEVYWSLYERQASNIVRAHREQAGIPEQIKESLDAPCTFIGNGARRYATRIEQCLPYPVTFADEQCDIPQPGTLARLGMQRLKRKQFDDPHSFSPVYLRKSDAKKSVRVELKPSGN